MHYNSGWDTKFENMEPAADSDNTEIVPDVDIEKERQELEAKIKEDERVYISFCNFLLSNRNICVKRIN